MGKWLSYGKESHDTPLIIRLLGQGPSEGAEWECRCGKVHRIVEAQGTLVWDWRVAAAVYEASAQARRKFDPDRETMADYLLGEWLDSVGISRSAADAGLTQYGDAIQFTLEWLAEHGQLRGPEVKQA